MQDIEHPGTVAFFFDGEAKVDILRTSPCGACHAKNLCGTESESRRVRVRTQRKDLKAGDPVIVVVSAATGVSAVFFAYLLPLFIFLGVFFLTDVLTGNEGLSGLLALFVLVPFYVGIWLLRDRFAGKFHLKLKDTA